MNCPSCQSPNDDRDAACARCGAVLGLPPLAPGMVLANRYEIGPQLGKGGMGVVYRAHDRLLSETVAIKVLRADAQDTAEMTGRFLAEIKLARSVSHRNVCRIHEYGEDRGLRYISMAYVDGQDLKHVIARKPLAVDEAFRIAIAVAEGLDAIHEEGIVHRDLKPQNVMIDARGLPRLMDFGIAKQADVTSGLTEAGRIVGTPEYMSPEQVRGQRLDRRSDVYALGVMVHEIFAGRAPFRGDTPVAVLMKHIQEPPEIDVTRLPGPLLPIVRRALSKDREGRYPTAREMARDLEEARAKVASRAITAQSPATLQETGDLAALGQATTDLPAEAPPGPRPAQGPRPALTAPTAAPRSRPASRPGWLPFVIGAVVVAGGGLALRQWRAPEPAPPVSTAVATPAPVAPTEPPPTPTLGVAPPTPAPVATSTPVAVSRPNPTTPGPAVVTSPPPPVRTAPTPPPVDDVLRRAEAELIARRYDAAIALYDEALRLDPQNGTARELRTAALKARVAAEVPVATPPPASGEGARRLVAGETVARPAEGAADKAFAEGFETRPDLEVTRDSGPDALPGRLLFEVQPEQMKAGQPYAIKVSLQNTGRAPIDVAALNVTTVRDGRRSSGGVAPLTKTVAPRQTAPLMALTGEIWPDGVRTWSMEVVLRTSRGETYRNQLVAK
jgi:predicted Ser/Thr protein kinase